MKNKVVILSNASSIHTIQWAIHLKNQGLTVEVVSQHPKNDIFPFDIPVHILPRVGQIGYFLNVIALKKLLKKIQPDIVNAHYATGYGTTARLANFHPYVLSVWGSDVYEFPYRSFIHKRLLKKNLAAADSIASTSNNMAEQTKLFLPKNKPISITPFGIDFDKFRCKSNTTESKNDRITIGTVKTLKHVYGIDILLKALSILYKNLDDQKSEFTNKLDFRIVGGGTDLAQLKQLAVDLGIDHITTFVGAVPHEKVPAELSKLDIYVALSRQESFGVAVIEAQAIGIPVVVSNVGGLPEVVDNGETGFIIESENPVQAARKIEKLILDSKLRQHMGNQARSFVESSFSWEFCAENMIQVYQNTLLDFKD